MSKLIVERLRGKRRDLIAKANELLDKMKDHEPTAAESLELTATKAAIENINAEMDAAREMLGHHGTLPAESITTRIAPPVSRMARGRTYAELFGPPSAASEWPDAEAFLEAVGAGVYHPALVPTASGMKESGGSSGGYLVPVEYSARMLDDSLESEIVRPRADIYAMSGEQLKVPGWDSADHSGGELFGGLTAAWLGEAGSMSIEDPKLRQVTLTARKLGILSKASNEMRADGLGFDAQLTNALVRATSFHLDYAFLRGTGAGQPLGVLNDPALVVASKQGGQVANTITYVNCVDMLARLHPSCFANSVWIASNSTLPQLLALSLPIGTSGSHVPAVVSDNGAFSLLTRPLLLTEKLPVLGDEGDLILADFSQYAIGLRAEVSIERSQHVYFTTDEVAYRAIVRIDGQGKWNAAVTPRNGGDTLSWCVALEAR